MIVFILDFAERLIISPHIPLTSLEDLGWLNLQKDASRRRLTIS